MNTFEQIVSIVEATKKDAEQFFGEKQNAQAGKRLRANAKEIFDAAKALRKEVSTLKAERKIAADAAKA